MHTNAQIEEKLYRDDVFGVINLFWRNPRGRSQMMLYASLNPTQRRMMLSGLGLGLETLGPEQVEYLCKVFRDERVLSGEIRALLKCTVATREKRTPEYTFVVSSAQDGAELGKCVVALPKYIEPPKPDDAKGKPDIKTTEAEKGKQAATK